MHVTFHASEPAHGVTVRDELARLGLTTEIPGLESTGGLLLCGPAEWIVDEGGRTGWVLCGGQAILALPIAGVSRRIVYLVRDDSAGEAWEAKARELGSVMYPVALVHIGPKPSPVLRLHESM